MKPLEGLNEIELEIIENGISVEEVYTNEVEYVKLLVPKLMPGVSLTTPNVTRNYINNAILVNDVSSMPKINYVINTSNYIDVKKGASYGWHHLFPGDHVDLYIRNKNLKDISCINTL